MNLDSSTQVLITSTATFSAIYLLSGNGRKLNKLPGPHGIPFFGNALQMDSEKPNISLSKWAEQYGDIYKLNLFGEDVVVVNSYEGITELFLTKSNDYAGRPLLYRSECFFLDTDIALSDMEPKWSLMKKTCSKGLKQVGEQLSELDNILKTVMDELIETLSSHSGSPIDVRKDIFAAMAHIIFILTYGRGLTKSEHKEFMTVANDTNECFSPAAEYAILDNIPWLRNPLFPKYNDLRAKARRVNEFFALRLEETINNHQEGIKCIMDELINEMKRPSPTKSSQLSFYNLDSVGKDLTIAGTMTTSSALYCLIALLATNPDIQKEAYMCIVEAIGDRTPTVQDRLAIPYIESMILELLRLLSHVPVALPHKTLVDSTLLGHEIPKGTMIWANLWYLHHDPKLWEDPWSFKPKRFLDEQGNFVTADHPLRKRFYAFGAGRRVCLGESLAKIRMFIVIVTLMQKFEFVQPKGESIDIDPRNFKLGVALTPDDYKVLIKPRLLD